MSSLDESSPSDNSTSPPSDSQSPPSNGSTSPPSSSSPPSDEGGSSPSPPPPSSGDSPSQSSPPPPSPDESPSQSPPPPSSGSSPSQSPPPPQEEQNPPPPPSDNGNSGSNNSNGSPSPPPPPKSSGGGSSSSSSPSPPPPSSSRSGSSSSSNSPSPPSLSLSPPSLPSSSSSSFDNEKAIIAGAAAGASLFLLIMIIFLFSCCKKKKRKPHHGHMNYHPQDSRASHGYYNSGQHDQWNNKLASSEQHWLGPPPPPPAMANSSDLSSAGFSGGPPLPPPHPAMALGFNQSSFTYNDLAAATGGFAQSNLLGQGGFGYVHKGVLPNGKEIAVKSLKANSGQGEREFQAEVDIISRVHHRHLVSLVGYCIYGSQRLLVYEFVANGTLEFHLHGTGRPTMEWSMRLRIALGSAKGFAYLHEDCHPRIIHRDIKAANILLDENFEAKVADFGLAKLSSDTNTHVSTRIMGTFGYLAPEYASSGKLTEKSDVYSYGIMLLELISGRRPVDISRDDDDDTLVDWARPYLAKVSEGGDFDGIVDPRLGDGYNRQEMHQMVACAAACVRHSARRRPKMSQIVRALEGDVSLDDLNEGAKAGGSSGSSEYDVKRVRNNPAGALLSSQEFTSSEHGTTGEFA